MPYAVLTLCTAPDKELCMGDLVGADTARACVPARGGSDVQSTLTVSAQMPTRDSC